MKKVPYWSVIVPVYNESRRIGKLTHILQFLKKQKQTWELIVVDDGSTDQTRTLLQKLNRNRLFTIISYQPNQGKGQAVKRGMLSARGKYRLFLDVDLSTPIEEMNKLPTLLSRAEIVVGTRKAKGAKVVVHQPWLRETLGKGFTLLSQIILQVKVSDFTCGFKCYSAKAANTIFSRTRIFRWGFDSEVLFLASKYGFSLAEMPVTWSDDRRTRVRFPSDLITSLSELIRIRYHDLNGLYRL